MTFPVFDPNNLKFKAVDLTEWLRSLPENTMLRVFSTEDSGVKITWLERKDKNEIFAVPENDGRESTEK